MKYQITVKVDGVIGQFVCAPQTLSPEDLKTFEDEAEKRGTSLEMLILEAATSDWDENDAIQIFEARDTSNPNPGFEPWALVTSKILALKVTLFKEA
jgi:hypothetical protein